MVDFFIVFHDKYFKSDQAEMQEILHLRAIESIILYVYA